MVVAVSAVIVGAGSVAGRTSLVVVRLGVLSADAAKIGARTRPHKSPVMLTVRAVFVAAHI
jgi:hypothetical protein